MGWVEDIGEAVKYIEDSITQELKLKQIAKRACVSSFYFQKGFAMLCGFTVKDYIRQRRLSLAGSEFPWCYTYRCSQGRCNGKILCSVKNKIQIGRRLYYGLQDCEKGCIYGGWFIGSISV